SRCRRPWRQRTCHPASTRWKSKSAITCPSRAWTRQYRSSWSKLIGGLAVLVGGDMLRKLGILMAVMGLALPAWSAVTPGTISGYVRNAGGIPQMGAAVELLGSAVAGSKAFTDDRGFYSISGLLPGTYDLKVSAPSFLPALREKVGLRS